MQITTLTSLISLFGYLAVICLNLLIMLIIWMPERKRVRSVFLISWISLWAIIIGVLGSTGSGDILHSLILLMSVPVMLVLTITWYFCYFQKRLSVINPLLVGIGFTIWFLAIILRVYVSAVGTPIGYVFTDLHWIPLFLDIAAFSIITVGFSKEMST